MKKNVLITLIILAIITAGIVFLANRSNPSTPPSTPSAEGPSASQVLNLTFTDYDGQNVRLTDFQGKPLVINSWAAWCPFCVKELKDFAALQKEFKDEITIIAIDRAETKDTAEQYTDQLGVSNDLVFLLDPDDSFYKAVGGFSMPETIFVDENGSIVFHKRGPMDIKEMRERADQLISK